MANGLICPIYRVTAANWSAQMTEVTVAIFSRKHRKGSGGSGKEMSIATFSRSLRGQAVSGRVTVFAYAN